LTTKADHNKVRRGPILTDVLWLQGQMSGNDRQAGRFLHTAGHWLGLAGFWPHNSAQCCRLLRISEQDPTRSTGI
jgi:hypothetical protein